MKIRMFLMLLAVVTVMVLMPLTQFNARAAKTGKTMECEDYIEVTANNKNWMQGMAIVGDCAYSAMVNTSTHDVELWRTDLTTNASVQLSCSVDLGHANDMCAIDYNGSTYLFVAYSQSPNPRTVILLKVSGTSVTKVSDISYNYIIGGLTILSNKNGIVTLLIKGSGETCFTDEINLKSPPAEGTTRSLQRAFSVTYNDMMAYVRDVLGLTDSEVDQECLRKGTAVDGVNQAGIYATQGIGYDSRTDKLYLTLTILKNENAGDKKQLTPMRFFLYTMM